MFSSRAVSANESPSPARSWPALRCLLLDEPTSQLDALTEAELRASLNQLRARRTVIVVAHRLATVLDADQIIVLEDGRVRATGTHSDLAEHDSLYRSFCHSQNLTARTR